LHDFQDSFIKSLEMGPEIDLDPINTVLHGEKDELASFIVVHLAMGREYSTP
jgi:hypothetical protein